MSFGSGWIASLVGAALLVGSACPAALAADPPPSANGQIVPAKPPTEKSTAGKSNPDKSTSKPTTVDKTSNAKTGAANKTATAKKTPAKKTPARPPAPLSAEREAAALAFAREQHPELAALIEKLRHGNRRAYDRAIREVWQASDRLTRLKKQSAEQYELSLAAWKLDSRTRLLAARMTVSQTPGLEAELKQLLAERADVRLKEYKFERARLQDRLSKVNASIQALETNKNGLVEKDLQRIKRSVARGRRPTPRPANKSSQSAVASKAPVTEPPRPPAVPTAASVNPPAAASAASRTADKQQH